MEDKQRARFEKFFLDDCFSNSPLHIAVHQNSKEEVEILLKNGAELETYNRNLETPLDIALRQNSIEIVEILITNGADVSAKNCNSETPLDVAVRQNSTEIAEILISSSANRELIIEKNPLIFDHVMRSCNDGMTNLFLEKFTLNEIVKTRNVAFIKFCLERGSNVKATTESGITPLHWAIECNLESIALLLLDYKTDVNSKDIKGLTALHKAVLYDASSRLIDRLLENGASLNAKDDHDLIPLNYAVNKQNLRLIRFILDRNPDLNDKDNKLAFCLSFIEDINICKPFKPVYPFYYQRVRRPKMATEIFVDRGFTLTVQDFDNVFVPKNLYPFIKDEFENKEFRSRVQETLNKTATNLQEFDKLFLLYEVLKRSIERGFIDIVNNLLTPFVNVNIPMTTGLTMLHSAVINGHLPVVQKLLGCGADVNVLDENNEMSALHISIYNHRNDIATVLLKNNANLEVRNQCNQTPLQFAADNNSCEIAVFLLNVGAKINTFYFRSHKSTYLPFIKALLYFGFVIETRNFLNLVICSYDRSDHNIDLMKLVLNHNIVCDADSFIDFKVTLSKESKLKLKELVIKYVTFHGTSTNYSVKSKWYNFQIKCQEEIERMKLTNIEGFKITVDDVLRKSPRQIARYLNNEDLIQALEKMDFEKSFPLYESKIKAHVEKGEVTKRLLELSSTCLEHISKFTLPILVKDIVLSYLDDQELRRLIFLSPIDEVEKASIQYKYEFKVDENKYNQFNDDYPSGETDYEDFYDTDDFDSDSSADNYELYYYYHSSDQSDYYE